MKYIVFILIFFAFSSFSQTWQSVSRSSICQYQWTPYNQFIINPFLNQLWFVRDESAAVIENDGTFRRFTDIELGTTWTHDEMKFAFTPNHIYYARDYFGLYSFDGYISQEEYAFTDYKGIIRSSGGESVFILQVDPYNTYVEFNESYVDTPYRGAKDMAVKNNFIYATSSYSNIYYYTIPGFPDFVNIHTDPDYVGGYFNEMKFSRLTDTLYVAGKNGISFAYNYDFLDTITPNNTTGMPSANVLEIEFDQNDNIWAVFGDAADNPIGLAKLEGSTLTNFYDSNNSPIDFSTFYGMEIDTLGNVWVVDYMSLHTILTPNSPQWLGQQELVNDSNILVYPNPAKEKLSISSPSEIINVKIVDITGSVINTILNPQNTIDISALSKGVYFISIETVQGNSLERFVKE